MNTRNACRTLEAVGLTPADAGVVAGIVVRFPRWTYAGSLTFDDLWSEAIVQAWQTKNRVRDPAKLRQNLRVRVHGALIRLCERERRATGGANATFFWPWYRPSNGSNERTCEGPGCDVVLPPSVPTRKRCVQCADEQRLAMQRNRMQQHRARRRSAGIGDNRARSDTPDGEQPNGSAGVASRPFSVAA